MKKKQQSHDQKMWDYLQVDERKNRYKGKNPRQEGVLKKARQIMKKRKEGGKILEVGIGAGLVLNGLAKNQKNECLGVDIAEENVKLSNEKMGKENLKFMVISENGELPFEDESFDLVIVSEVFEHMPDLELETSVKEIWRVMKKGGRAIVTFPSHENLKVNECKCPECGLVFHKVGHKQSWDEKRVKEVFENFEMMEMKERFWRFEGENWFEKLGGGIMWILRNGALKLMKKRLDVPTWVLILGK